MPLDDTHDPGLRSWVESANDPASDFPVQNLPYCVFEPPGAKATLCVALGDRVVDLAACHGAGLLPVDDDIAEFLAADDASMLGILCGDREFAADFRRLVSRLARTDSPLATDRTLASRTVHAIADGRLHPPMSSENYTDFYASIHHATTVGSMFRPDNPLLPNYKHVPIGYHGRASSIVPSGTDVHRPRGQLPPPDDKPGEPPTFGPTRMLDYELEVGIVIGPGNTLGRPVPIGDAERSIFGLCLVNDWSARDIQKWEYQPLGPFLAKNFATSISPFIVTREALEPFRCPAYARPAGDPRPLPYLLDEADQARGGVDITLEVWLQSDLMRRRSQQPVMLSRSRAFRDMYWTPAQLVAHHTSNGCNLHPGDLLASGTVSGVAPNERGCLLELTWAGRGPDGKPLPRRPIELPSGEKRTFLEDGDEVSLRGYCERPGYRRIGFGECRGRIVPTNA